MNAPIIDDTDALLLARKDKSAQRAEVREDECIGCTKCITACPTDSIIGASKQMHTIIADACSGCELCVPACPVDCIDLVSIAQPDTNTMDNNVARWRMRYREQQDRLAREKQRRMQRHEQAKLMQANQRQTLAARQKAIREAVARTKTRKVRHPVD